MQLGRRTTAKNGVISGSVWDSSVKIGEGKGGMKVFNGEDNSGLGGSDKICRRLKRNQSGVGGVGEKRKIGKSEPNEVIGRSPIQMRKTKSDSHRFADGSRKDLSVSVDEIEKNPIQLRKTRSESHTCKEIQINSSNVGEIRSPRSPGEGDGVDGGEEIEKNQIQLKKTRSDFETCKQNQINLSSSSNVGQIESQRLAADNNGVDGEEIEKKPIQIREAKFDSHPCKGNQINSSSPSNVGQIESRRPAADDGDVKGDEEDEGEEIEKNPIQIRENRSDSIESQRLVHNDDDDDDDDEEDELEEDEAQEDIEMEIEKESFDLKEINIPEQKIKKVINEEKLEQINRTSLLISSNSIQVKNHPINDPEFTTEQPCKLSEELEISPEIKNKLQNPISSNVSKEKYQVKNHPHVIKPPPCTISEEFEISPETQNKLKNPISSIVSKQTSQLKNHPVIHQKLRKPPQISEVFDIFSETQSKLQKPISSNVRKPTPQVENHPEIRRSPPFAVSEDFERFPKTQSKLQNIVDLVMWKDVPRSAFVFGCGTFFLLSSSFTKDLNFSLISAISYMGLLYLAAIFLYKSILCRGAIDCEESDQTHMVGEEEAIWFLELILPYLNEFLLKLRGLFSGHPATTLKLALFLFVLARCGSSITIWKMAKLGFFGAFIVPKVCSSYSTQITAYGNFWIRRFWDAWDSCSHKKAVIAAIFTLVWNLSSVVARTWAAFMLIVAVRYYQQSLLREEWGEEQRQRQDDGPTLVELQKEKKGS